jgi:hypothetical protein
MTARRAIEWRQKGREEMARNIAFFALAWPLRMCAASSRTDLPRHKLAGVATDLSAPRRISRPCHGNPTPSHAQLGTPNGSAQDKPPSLHAVVRQRAIRVAGTRCRGAVGEAEAVVVAQKRLVARQRRTLQESNHPAVIEPRPVPPRQAPHGHQCGCSPSTNAVATALPEGICPSGFREVSINHM